jgi:anthraniloyl-CoA monooxygenase
VHSGVRELLGAGFRTSVTAGRDTFIWLGTPQRFDAFTFGFEQTAAGWVWFHAYSFDPQTSTFIVECAPETWKGLGFDELQPDESTAVLQRIFARHLDGQPLINQLSELGVTPWLTFTRIRNPRWVHGNLALMGDAAHTTHFSIGSGTTLAIQDSIALAQQLDSRPDLPSALAAYDRQRRAEMAAWHAAADNSARWYEQVDQHVAQSPVQFGYSMLRRRHGEQLPHEPLRWRYRVYLATQVRPLRAVRHLITAARRRRRVHARSE